MDLFNWKKFLYLKKNVESSHFKQLSHWYLWKDEVEKCLQRNMMASCMDSLNKVNERKLNRIKIKVHIQCKFPFLKSGPSPQQYLTLSIPSLSPEDPLSTQLLFLTFFPARFTEHAPARSLRPGCLGYSCKSWRPGSEFSRITWDKRESCLAPLKLLLFPRALW